MIELLKQGVLNSTTFMILSRNENEKSDSEFDLDFPLSCHEELTIALNDKVVAQEYFMPTKNGKDVHVQFVHIASIEVVKDKVNVCCIGLVRNYEQFPLLSTETVPPSENRPTLTKSTYSLN